MIRILVAVDTTEMAEIVIEQAITIARPKNAKLRLMQAIPETLEPPVANMFEPGGDVLARVQATEKRLELLEAELPEEVRDGVMVEVGRVAWESILAAARRYDADWIVIGAHRYNLLERALGTTAAAVVNRSECPVFVVRPTPKPAATTAAHQSAAMREPSPEAALPKPSVALVSAAALAGAASGAAVGAIGGPPGAIIGGAIGTAVGLIAGSTLDLEDQRASAHDHELDDAIGVTKGDLGLGAAGGRPRAGDPDDGDGGPQLSELAIHLRGQHAFLETAYSTLLWSYRAGDWPDVIDQWSRFEPALREHMRFEEEEVFPIFGLVNKAEVEALRAEHDELRALLGTLSVNVELHAFPAADAEELVKRLRAHGRREDKLLYPWIEATLNGKTGAQKAIDPTKARRPASQTALP